MVPLDTNLQKAHREKDTKYINLMSKMQKLYGGDKFEIIVIAVGAMGAVPVPLEGSLKKLFPENENIEQLIQCIQKAAILGTLKVCKTALGMRSQ